MKPVSNAFRKEIDTKATWIQSESKVNPKWINLLRLFKILVEQQLQKPSLNDLLGSSPDAPHRPRVPGHNAQQCPTGNAIDQGGG